jgi:hypothetical protein
LGDTCALACDEKKTHDYQRLVLIQLPSPLKRRCSFY